MASPARRHKSGVYFSGGLLVCCCHTPRTNTLSRGMIEPKVPPPNQINNVWSIWFPNAFNSISERNVIVQSVLTATRNQQRISRINILLSASMRCMGLGCLLLLEGLTTVTTCEPWLAALLVSKSVMFLLLSLMRQSSGRAGLISVLAVKQTCLNLLLALLPCTGSPDHLA